MIKFGRVRFFVYVCGKENDMNTTIINSIKEYLADKPITKCWLFGSYARGEETPNSDIDLLVEFDRTGKPVTLLTYSSIWRGLKEFLGKEVDLVENGTLKPYAVQSAENDKILIYERKS